MIKNLLKIVRRFFKKKYIIAVIVTSMLFGIGAETYNWFILNRQKCMVIEFNYPGSEKGLNPDGSVFEISNLKSNEVIDRAKENLKDQDIDTEFLQSRIFITSKVPSSSLDKIVSAVQNEKNIIYLPTTFYVYYSQKNKLAKNESKIFMESLAEAYREYFGEKYTEKNDILAFSSDMYDFENMDYEEIHTVLYNKVDSMLSFIRTHQNENRAFLSTDRENLGMAAKKLESFRDVNLEKLYAYIVQNHVSKDNKEYVARVGYLIDTRTREYNKEKDASDIAKEALDRYDPRIAAVAFVPSIDAKHDYYMSRTKTGLDDLTRQSYTDGISASRILKEIESYKNLQTKFSTVAVSPHSFQYRVDTMIEALSDELSEVSLDVLKIDNEYLQHKTMNYFNIKLPADYSLNLSLVIKMGMVGFMLSLAIVVFWELLKEKIKHRLQTVKQGMSMMSMLSSEGDEK